MVVWKKIRVVALLSGVVLAPFGAIAQVPVVDVASISQQIQNLQQMLADYGLQTEQLTALQQQLALAEQELTKLDELRAMLSDPTELIGIAMGSDLDGVLEGEFEPGTMLETIRSGSSGNWSGVVGSSGERFRDAIATAYDASGTSQEEVTAMAESDDEMANRNAQATASSAATSAAAEIAYEEAQQTVTRVTELVTDIQNMETLKQAVDHNTRVTAELAIAMAALWQLESVQTMNDGMGGVLDAATLADIQNFNDFTPITFGD